MHVETGACCSLAKRRERGGKRTHMLQLLLSIEVACTLSMDTCCAVFLMRDTCEHAIITLYMTLLSVVA